MSLMPSLPINSYPMRRMTRKGSPRDASRSKTKKRSWPCRRNLRYVRGHRWWFTFSHQLEKNILHSVNGKSKTTRRSSTQRNGEAGGILDLMTAMSMSSYPHAKDGCGGQGEDAVQQKHDALLRISQTLETRRIIDKYTAATTIQSIARGFLCRRRGVLLRLRTKVLERRVKDIAAGTIQRHFREIRRIRWEKRRDRAATVINRRIHQYLTETPEEKQHRIAQRMWGKCVGQAVTFQQNLKRLQQLVQRNPQTTDKIRKLQAVKRGQRTRQVIRTVLRESGLLLHRSGGVRGQRASYSWRLTYLTQRR